MRKPGNVGGERPSPSFLTQEQREALDAALLKKRAEQRECSALDCTWATLVRTETDAPVPHGAWVAACRCCVRRAVSLPAALPCPRLLPPPATRTQRRAALPQLSPRSCAAQPRQRPGRRRWALLQAAAGQEPAQRGREDKARLAARPPSQPQGQGCVGVALRRVGCTSTPHQQPCPAPLPIPTSPHGPLPCLPSGAKAVPSASPPEPVRQAPDAPRRAARAASTRGVPPCWRTARRWSTRTTPTTTRVGSTL